MVSALRVLGAALVGFYDETFLWIRGNLVWVAIALPYYLCICLALLPLATGAGGSGDDSSGWPFFLGAWLVAIVPTPGGLAIAGMARTAITGDTPRIEELTTILRSSFVLGTGLFATSTLGLALIAVNVGFYASALDDRVRLVSILWVYAGVFWIGLQLYLAPLALHLSRPRLFDLYRRAAVLSLSQPAFTLTLVLLLTGCVIAATMALPVYLLAIGAVVALVQAHAFQSVRRQLGDAPADEERGT